MAFCLLASYAVTVLVAVMITDCASYLYTLAETYILYIYICTSYYNVCYTLYSHTFGNYNIIEMSHRKSGKQNVPTAGAHNGNGLLPTIN